MPSVYRSGFSNFKTRLCVVQLVHFMENDRFGEIGEIHDSIFQHIISKENLFAAWREFQNGKMGKQDVLEFSRTF